MIQNKFTEFDIIPIDEQLSKIDSSNRILNSILKCIQYNAGCSQKKPLWRENPQWNTSRMIAKNIEEIGLLARLNKNKGKKYKNEAIILINYLTGCLDDKNFIKNMGIHYELFLSETAISVIYTIEYFSPFTSVFEKKKLYDELSFISDSLWILIQEAPEFAIRSQSRLAWNHSLFVHAVTGICAIKQPNEHSKERLERAIVWTEGYLSHSWTWDGFSREGIFYAGYSRMPLLLFIIALKKHHSINLLGYSSLIHHGQYLIDEWIPKTFNFISRNDLNHYRHSTTLSSLLLHAHLLQCSKSLALWQAIVGEKGDKSFGNPIVENNYNGSLVLNYLFYPTELAYSSVEKYVSTFKVYREVGVVVGSSESDASFKYSFQASSHYSDIHSHADHGQLYLYLNGDVLLGDTAVGNKNQAGSPDQSEGHNSLMINGKGMALAGAGRQTCSILEDATNYGDYHVMRANLAPAYNAYNSRMTLIHYKRLVVVHTKEPYHIIILDSVVTMKKTDYLFSYRFHTDHNNKIFNEKEEIFIDAKNSKLKIIPLGLNWKAQDAEKFIFNNETRSSYIDTHFYSENFLGGYVLIPFIKNKIPVTSYKNNNDIFIESKYNKSCILFHSHDLLHCYSICKKNKEIINGISISKGISIDSDVADSLSGDIFPI